MERLVLLVAIFASVSAAPASNASTKEDFELNVPFLVYQAENGTFELEDLQLSLVEVTASESDVSYYFYSKSDSGVNVDNVAALKTTAFKASKVTWFIVHGWRNDKDSLVNNLTRTAVLSRHDINVFVVDWGRIAGKNYVTAKNAVTSIGKYVATYVDKLASAYGLKLSNVLFVGHSLGAHVCGNAGAALKGQLKCIVGLDPAYPLFSVGSTNDRLDPSDAKFVQVVHTNAGLLGFSSSIGHADYYPNGGSRQTGCGLDATGSCAHSRSYYYFSESVSAAKDGFVGTKCGSYGDFSSGKCEARAKSTLGGFSIDTKASGDYYLDTNSESPFAKG